MAARSLIPRGGRAYLLGRLVQHVHRRRVLLQAIHKDIIAVRHASGVCECGCGCGCGSR